MFYLVRDNQIAAAETPERAAALIERGWVLTTRAHYMALWAIDDFYRVQRLIAMAQIAAAQRVPLLEQEVGTHYSF